MRIFHPPLFGDAKPTSADESIPTALTQTLVERLLTATRHKAPAHRGHLVLLHDAGGAHSRPSASLTPGTVRTR